MRVIGYLHQTRTDGPPHVDEHVYRPWYRDRLYPSPLCPGCFPVWVMDDHADNFDEVVRSPDVVSLRCEICTRSMGSRRRTEFEQFTEHVSSYYCSAECVSASLEDDAW